MKQSDEVEEVTTTAPTIPTRTRPWKIWQAADKLEERASTGSTFYPTITLKVVAILRMWGETWAGKEEWMSLLDKGALHHEMEECIVAIHNMFENLDNSNNNLSTTTAAASSKGEGEGEGGKTHIPMDLCAGKGLFSFLLSYMKPPNVDQIVMLEKAKVNWFHIHEANKTAKAEGRPEIIIWANTNLHEYDNVLDRILALPHPVAMTGIHLCKQLSPSFCGIVNGLGKKCIYACLAPCCLPRAVTSQKQKKMKIRSRDGGDDDDTDADDKKKKHKSKSKSHTLSIQLRETSKERKSRRDYMERRERARRKSLNGPCFYCGDESHSLIHCTILPTLPKEDQIRIRQKFHAATVPCWNCLEYGHFKNNCPKAVLDGGAAITHNSTNHSSQYPPILTLDVTNVLAEERPFYSYCHLLANSFQKGKGGDMKNGEMDIGEEEKEEQAPFRRINVIESELEKSGKHQDGNWNSERKAIFIIVK